MELEGSQSLFHDDVTEAQLRAAFVDDKERGEFIILVQSDEVYIQASGEGDGPYSLEYRDGGKDRHFTAGRTDFTKADIERAFVYYLNGDERWRTGFAWKKLEKKPWWKLW